MASAAGSSPPPGPWNVKPRHVSISVMVRLAYDSESSRPVTSCKHCAGIVCKGCCKGLLLKAPAWLDQKLTSCSSSSLGEWFDFGLGDVLDLAEGSEKDVVCTQQQRALSAHVWLCPGRHSQKHAEHTCLRSVTTCRLDFDPSFELIWPSKLSMLQQQ